MRRALIPVLICAALVMGCAERDEIIATLPADGGAGGTGGGGLEAVWDAPEEHAITCGTADEAATGDIDGDGDEDVFVGGGCLNVLRGDGSGALGPSESPLASDFPSAFALGRIDTTHPQDGTDALDVVGFSQPMRLYIGDGSGAFETHAGIDAGPPGSTGSVLLVDLYDDDALELVTASGATVSLWTGDGTGAFVGPHPTTLGAPVLELHAGDVDGDAHVDLLAVTSGGVVVLRNDGMGAVTPDAITATENVRAIALAELDGDGCLDAVGLETGRIVTLLNDCHGLFTAAELSEASAVALAAGDVDGDGTADVVLAVGGDEPAITTARGRGDGTFESWSSQSLPKEPLRLRLADLDGDAAEDALLTHRDGSGVTTLRARR